MRALHAHLMRRASSRSVLRRLTQQSARETARPAGQLRICGTADTDKLGFGDWLKKASAAVGSLMMPRQQRLIEG